MSSRKRRNLVADVPLDSLRQVPGYPGYYASPTGQVYSIGLLSAARHNDGYLRVQAFHDDGETKVRHRLGIHQAVCRAFHGPPPFVGAQACHNNGNLLDNTPGNLRWDTVKENALDRVRHGTTKRGIANAKAILDEAQVLRIRAASWKEAREMAIEFGVSLSTVKAVRERRNWGWLD